MHTLMRSLESTNQSAMNYNCETYREKKTEQHKTNENLRERILSSFGELWPAADQIAFSSISNWMASPPSPEHHSNHCEGFFFRELAIYRL